MMLTLASLFDGIGGWLIAAHRNGVKPVWSSEIEPFPREVTKRHFPDVLQLGDVTKIDGGSDTARYKALGNGMAQPCADFIISCVVQMAEAEDEE